MTKQSSFDFLMYCVSEMRQYDLDCVIVIYGISRSSKSALAFNISEILTAIWFDLKTLDDADNAMKELLFKEKNIIYDDDDKRYVNLFNDKYIVPLIWNDESKLTFDARRSMDKKQIKRGALLDIFGDMNMVSLILTQNLSDLDKRAKSKANIYIGIEQRGIGIVNVVEKGLPIMKETPFEALEAKPEFMRGAKAARSVRGLPSYVFDVEFDYPDNIPLYKEIKEYKTQRQQQISI